MFAIHGIYVGQLQHSASCSHEPKTNTPVINGIWSITGSLLKSMAISYACNHIAHTWIVIKQLTISMHYNLLESSGIMYTADTSQADYITPLLRHSLATYYIVDSCWRWLLYPLEEYQEVGRQPWEKCNQETIDYNSQCWHVRRSVWQVILTKFDWISSDQEIKVLDCGPTKWSQIVATLGSRDLFQSHTISNAEMFCFSTPYLKSENKIQICVLGNRH